MLAFVCGRKPSMLSSKIFSYLFGEYSLKSLAMDAYNASGVDRMIGMFFQNVIEGICHMNTMI